jgi:hypothetical protein
VEANPQIVAVNAEATADLVLVAFLEEDGAQKVSVGRAQLLQDPTDVRLSLLIDERALQVNAFVGDVQVAVFQGPFLIVSTGILS